MNKWLYHFIITQVIYRHFFSVGNGNELLRVYYNFNYPTQGTKLILILSTVAQALLGRYQREGDGILGRIVAMNETWALTYEPNFKRQSNEWVHPDSPHLKKVRPTQCTVKVIFTVAYAIDGVMLHHSVPPSLRTTARSYSTTFVQRSGENDDTWWYRTPSFFMTVQGITPLLLSRTSCAAGNGRFWNIHRTHPMSPCDYDLSAKVKESLRRARYNTRDELIRAIGRPIRNINKSGRADGERRLPSI